MVRGQIQKKLRQSLDPEGRTARSLVLEDLHRLPGFPGLVERKGMSRGEGVLDLCQIEGPSGRRDAGRKKRWRVISPSYSYSIDLLGATIFILRRLGVFATETVVNTLWSWLRGLTVTE